MLQSIRNKVGVQLGLSINFFVIFFIVCAVGAYIPKVFAVYGFTPIEIGNLKAYTYAVGVAAPLIYSQISRKIGLKFSLQIGACAACLGVILLFFKFGFVAVAIISMVQYFFIRGTANQLDTLAIHSLEDKNVYGRIRIWGSLGFVFFAISGGWFADYFGLLNLKWYLGAVFITLLGTIFLLPDDEKAQQQNTTATNHDEHKTDNEDQATNTSQAINNEDGNKQGTTDQPTIKPNNDQPFSINIDFIFLMLFVLLECIAQAVYNNFFLIYVTTDLGYSNSVGSMILSLSALSEVAGLIASVRILSMFKIKPLLISVSLVSSLRWYLQGFMGDHMILLLLSQTFHIFTFALLHTSVLKYINENFHNKDHVGTAIGIYGSVGIGAGNIIGSLVAGQAWNVSPQLAYTYAIAMALAGGVFVLFIKNKTPITTNVEAVQTYDPDKNE